MNKNDKILVTGAQGLVGSALVRHLKMDNYKNIYSVSRKNCDLTSSYSTLCLFGEIKPDYVFHTAAKVYGIGGNLKNKGLSFYDNIMINTNVIEACHDVNVKKVVAMGTVASYPYEISVKVLKENMLFSGMPHHSEDSYGFAKRAMLAMLYAYKESYDLDWAYAISTNLYGPNDKFDIDSGHVVPSLISKFYTAKMNNDKIVIWGDGTTKRNFMYIDDLVKSLILIMDKFQGPINIGTNEIVSIKELVDTIATVSDFKNKIVYDVNMPKGRDFIPCDLTNLDDLGFIPDYNIKSGITSTWEWFIENYKKIRT